MTDEDGELNYAKMVGYLPIPSELEKKLRDRDVTLDMWGEATRRWAENAAAIAITGTTSTVVSDPTGPFTLTLEMLDRAIADVLPMSRFRDDGLDKRYPFGRALTGAGNFGDMRIVFSSLILRETKQRLFPQSLNRSRRVLKKLLRRYGSEFRRVPAIWISNGTLYAHPTFRQKLIDAGMHT